MSTKTCPIASSLLDNYMKFALIDLEEVILMDKFVLPYAMAMFLFMGALIIIVVLAAKNGYSEMYIISAGTLISFVFTTCIVIRQEKALMKFCERTGL